MADLEIHPALSRAFHDELTKIAAAIEASPTARGLSLLPLLKHAVATPVGAIMSAAHHGVAPESLGALGAFKQLKNVTRVGNVDAAKRIGGNLNDYLKTRPQPAV